MIQKIKKNKDINYACEYANAFDYQKYGDSKIIINKLQTFNNWYQHRGERPKGYDRIIIMELMDRTK